MPTQISWPCFKILELIFEFHEFELYKYDRNVKTFKYCIYEQY